MARVGDCPCGCDDCGEPSTAEVGEAVRGWLTRERLKIGTDITPEVAAIFERCAEDLEVGDGV